MGSLQWKVGDVVLMNWPHTDNDTEKRRPAVIVATDKDEYDNVIVCAVTSVAKYDDRLSISLTPEDFSNGGTQRVQSFILPYRIHTISATRITSSIGRLSTPKYNELRNGVMGLF